MLPAAASQSSVQPSDPSCIPQVFGRIFEDLKGSRVKSITLECAYPVLRDIINHWLMLSAPLALQSSKSAASEKGFWIWHKTTHIQIFSNTLTEIAQKLNLIFQRQEADESEENQVDESEESENLSYDFCLIAARNNIVIPPIWKRPEVKIDKKDKECLIEAFENLFNTMRFCQKGGICIENLKLLCETQSMEDYLFHVLRETILQKSDSLVGCERFVQGCGIILDSDDLEIIAGSLNLGFDNTGSEPTSIFINFRTLVSEVPVKWLAQESHFEMQNLRREVATKTQEIKALQEEVKTIRSECVRRAGKTERMTQLESDPENCDESHRPSIRRRVETEQTG